jgi:hypothetical protein
MVRSCVYLRFNQVIVERRRFSVEQSSALETTKDTIRKLLGTPSRHWPILSCYGARLVYAPPDYAWGDATVLDVLYTFPVLSSSMSMPRTLQQVLRCKNNPSGRGQPNQPLNTRVRLAKSVANAVLFVHIAGLVHKNIRPETILLFPPTTQMVQQYEPDLGDAFLVGFTESRDVAAVSYSSDQEKREHLLAWFNRIYEHPSRETAGVTRYTMLHDIYALGVVLLEIGIWRSFVGGPMRFGGDTVPAPLWAFNGRIPTSRAESKGCLIKFAQDTLPFCMGDSYTEVVLSCLTCMDNGEGSVLGAKYIELVLDRLDKLQL